IYGEPCGASPLKPGTLIEGVEVAGDFCMKHDPDVPDGAWKRFVQDPALAVRRSQKIPTPFELMAQAMAKAPGLIFRPHLEALGLQWDAETDEFVKVGDGARVIGFSREGYARVSKHKDLDLQMRAAERLKDRIYGKPRQALDVAGGLAHVQVAVPKTLDRAKIVAKVLQDAGAIAGQGPAADAESIDD
ncbi:MAG: hypothetical protein LC674_01435, partial [Actinobacteria bacterium]|nr:hypothetical protein [Actinomycetota bacterium]